MLSASARTKLKAKNLLSLCSIAAILILASALAILNAGAQEADIFITRPYLQLGDNPQLKEMESEELVWLSLYPEQVKFAVKLKRNTDKDWRPVSDISTRKLPVSGRETMSLVTCKLKDLPPGEKFEYQVLVDNKPAFTSQATARKSVGQKYRFSVFGDCGAGTTGQRKIAFRCYQEHPDFLVIPGDIVYHRGRFEEYLEKFFPVYGTENASLQTGAPLLSTSLLMPVLGNHDIGNPNRAADLGRFPDGLAYFYLYSLPLNGPSAQPGQPGALSLTGTEGEINAFMRSAGKNFPATSNYSFDYGNSHWLILDGNFYTQWASLRYRDWVKRDLESARNATWKFVSFHQPGFSADTEHANEQRMRLLSDIFQDQGVDIVFSGHAHNYQKTFPLRFTAKNQPAMQPNGTVPGAFQFDKTFDGIKNTVPRGVIYIVSGAGGAPLYQFDESSKIEHSFIDKFIGTTHSFTLCDVEGGRLSLKQISEDGKILDQFTISKNFEPQTKEAKEKLLVR